MSNTSKSQKLKVMLFYKSKPYFNHKPHARDYADFQREFPNITVDFIQTLHAVHDLFIILDYDTTNERILHCGGSSKDAGNKLMAIMEFSDGLAKNGIHDEIRCYQIIRRWY